MSSDIAAWDEPSADGGGAVIQKRPPLGVQVAAALRKRITTQGLDSGTPLPAEAQLATEFGVSQRVVRDALRTLHQEGIIETSQGKRAVVGDLHPVAVENYFKFAVDSDNGAISELMELRLVLESLAARLAASRATDDERAEMKRLLAELEACGSDLERRVPADLALHQVVVRASHNRLIYGFLRALNNALTEERRRGGQLVESAGLTHRESDDQHAALIEAVVSGDPDAAELCARTIVERARAHFEQRGQ